MNTTVKILLTLLVIGGGVGYMIYTTVSSGEALEYFKHVDEVVKSDADWNGRRVQLHGNVVKGTILKSTRSLDFRFALHRGGEWIDVSYRGIVPDAFKGCAELVVKGAVKGPRAFTADQVTAKCPSKYDDQRETGCGEELGPRVVAHRDKNK